MRAASEGEREWKLLHNRLLINLRECGVKSFAAAAAAAAPLSSRAASLLPHTRMCYVNKYGKDEHMREGLWASKQASLIIFYFFFFSRFSAHKRERNWDCRRDEKWEKRQKFSSLVCVQKKHKLNGKLGCLYLSRNFFIIFPLFFPSLFLIFFLFKNKIHKYYPSMWVCIYFKAFFSREIWIFRIFIENALIILWSASTYSIYDV